MLFSKLNKRRLKDFRVSYATTSLEIRRKNVVFHLSGVNVKICCLRHAKLILECVLLMGPRGGNNRTVEELEEDAYSYILSVVLQPN